MSEPDQWEEEPLDRGDLALLGGILLGAGILIVGLYFFALSLRHQHCERKPHEGINYLVCAQPFEKLKR